MIYGDYHTHTCFSTDSTAKPEDMIERAIALGLTQYCITDHMDYLYPHNKNGEFTFNVKDYWTCLTELKERYASKIELLIGVELGLRNEADCKHQVKCFFEQLVKQYSFDFVLGSTHVLDNYDPYLKGFWEHRSKEEGLFNYFHSIEQNAKYYSMFQVYGHLDYIIRYVPGDIKDYSVSEFIDSIDAALLALIDAGKGIECNTSGYKYGLNSPHPKLEILKRYRELGGEIITIGSDAHKTEFIAHEFEKASQLLQSLGFRYYTTYRNQIPKFHKLK